MDEAGAGLLHSIDRALQRIEAHLHHSRHQKQQKQVEAEAPTAALVDRIKAELEPWIEELVASRPPMIPSSTPSSTPPLATTLPPPDDDDDAAAGAESPAGDPTAALPLLPPPLLPPAPVSRALAPMAPIAGAAAAAVAPLLLRSPLAVRRSEALGGGPAHAGRG